MSAELGHCFDPCLTLHLRDATNRSVSSKWGLAHSTRNSSSMFKSLQKKGLFAKISHWNYGSAPETAKKTGFCLPEIHTILLFSSNSCRRKRPAFWLLSQLFRWAGPWCPLQFGQFCGAHEAGAAKSPSAVLLHHEATCKHAGCITSPCVRVPNQISDANVVLLARQQARRKRHVAPFQQNKSRPIKIQDFTKSLRQGSQTPSDQLSRLTTAPPLALLLSPSRTRNAMLQRWQRDPHLGSAPGSFLLRLWCGATRCQWLNLVVCV